MKVRLYRFIIPLLFVLLFSGYTTCAKFDAQPLYLLGLQNLSLLNPSSHNNTIIPAQIAVGLVSGNTTESGGQASFTVQLLEAPTKDVNIPVFSNNTGEGTVNQSNLTFTPLDWNVAQAVQLTGVNDLTVDGNVSYTVILSPSVSQDSRFNGIDPTDVTVINLDDENTPGSIIVSTISSNTLENGVPATFTVVLGSAPTSTVTVGISSSNINEGTVSPASLSFTGANWSTPKSVTVTGADDLIADGRQSFTVILAPAVSTDPRYNGIDPADITLQNRDDEWFTGYTYRRRITFGTSHGLLYRGYTATVVADTTLASLASGNDIRIVWHQLNGTATELDRLGAGWKSAANSISFRLQSDIPVNMNEDADGAYFIYYTNPSAGIPPSNEMNVYYFADFFNRADNAFVGNFWMDWDAAAGQDVSVSTSLLLIAPTSGMAGIKQTFSLGAIPDNFITEFDWNIFPTGGPAGENTWYFWFNIGDAAFMIDPDNKTGVGVGLYSCKRGAGTDCASTNHNIDNDLTGPMLETGITGAHTFRLVVNTALSTYDYSRDGGAPMAGVGFVNPGILLDQIRIGSDNFNSGPAEYHTMDNVRIYLNPALPPTVSVSLQEIQ